MKKASPAGFSGLTVVHADALSGLAGLPDHSVQTIITSPPYYGLRDYGTGGMAWPDVEYCPLPGLPEMRGPAWHGELGSEPSLAMFVGHIVAIFRAARRVLRKDGTMWINMGDSYAAGGMGAGSGKQKTVRGLQTGGHIDKPRKAPEGFKPKDLLGVPWRVAFALQADGWTLRSEIIWAKPNPMPESIKDRPTKAHEHLFLFSAGPKYFYDANAIKEQVSQSTVHRMVQDIDSQQGSLRANGGEEIRPMKAGGRKQVVPAGWETRPGKNHKIHEDGRAKETQYFDKEPSDLRNKRDVWEIATQGFPGAHFAAYPPALVRPCVLAGSRPGDTVLDMFGGSGTTGQVALEEGRRCVLIEPNPKYVQLIHERTRNVTPGLGI